MSGISGSLLAAIDAFRREHNFKKAGCLIIQRSGKNRCPYKNIGDIASILVQ